MRALLLQAPLSAILSLTSPAFGEDLDIRLVAAGSLAEALNPLITDYVKTIPSISQRNGDDRGPCATLLKKAKPSTFSLPTPDRMHKFCPRKPLRARACFSSATLSARSFPRPRRSRRTHWWISC